MEMKKLTCHKVRAFAKEEAMAAKEYRSYGLLAQAHDEAKHAKYFKRMLKGRK
jgi:hypothetical protein